MGFLSKAWKGVKGVVKKAARTIKKVAKKVAYATPGGKQAWKLSGKIGTKVMGVINKIGPIGMIAISIIAPYLAPLWAAFGAAASAAGGIWGAVGTAIYNGANWVGSTLASMTSGISKGISTIADKGLSGLANGSLSTASKEVVKGFADAFTGKAGAAGVKAGIEAASQSALTQAAGKSVWDQTVSKIMGDETTGATNILEKPTDDAYLQNQPVIKSGDLNLEGVPNQASPVANPRDQMIAEGKTNADIATVNRAKVTVDATLKSSGGGLSTELVTNPSLLSKASNIGKALLDGGSSTAKPLTAYTPNIPSAGRLFGGDGSAKGGIGSGGGEFLSQSMYQAIQEQQQRMARGFG